LLSHHLLEEWDHEKFFSEALKVVGCDGVLVSTARPILATLEWVHVTGAIAVCSGFMEYSSNETGAVRGWHSMLVETGLLPEAAIEQLLVISKLISNLIILKTEKGRFNCMGR